MAVMVSSFNANVASAAAVAADDDDTDDAPPLVITSSAAIEDFKLSMYEIASMISVLAGAVVLAYRHCQGCSKKASYTVSSMYSKCCPPALPGSYRPAPETTENYGWVGAVPCHPAPRRSYSY